MSRLWFTTACSGRENPTAESPYHIDGRPSLSICFASAQIFSYGNSERPCQILDPSHPTSVGIVLSVHGNKRWTENSKWCSREMTTLCFGLMPRETRWSHYGNEGPPVQVVSLILIIRHGCHFWKSFLLSETTKRRWRCKTDQGRYFCFRYLLQTQRLLVGDRPEIHFLATECFGPLVSVNWC